MSGRWQFFALAAALAAASAPAGEDGGVARTVTEPVSGAPIALPAPSAEPAPSSEDVARGAALYTAQNCSVCHSNDGRVIAAPSFKGLYGREEKLRDGKVVTVDDAYIRESILNPGAKVTVGFQPIMPPYAGRLDDVQLQVLIAYLKSLR